MRPVHQVPSPVSATPAARHTRPGTDVSSHVSGSEPSITPNPIPTTGRNAEQPRGRARAGQLALKVDAHVLGGPGRRREPRHRGGQSGSRVGTDLPAGGELAQDRVPDRIDRERADDVAVHLKGAEGRRPDRRIPAGPTHRHRGRLPRLQLRGEGAQRLHGPHPLRGTASP